MSEEIKQNQQTQKTDNPSNSTPRDGSNNSNEFVKRGDSSAVGNLRKRSAGRDRDRKGGRNRNSKLAKKAKPKEEDIASQVISVRRVTRVAKGGKRMRFSALVVVGDKKGRVGYAISKGLDYQDSVAKAIKKAKSNLIKIKLDDSNSLEFASNTKVKACRIVLKNAKSGTGLISGGYVRPMLELAGVENIYSKILGSRNKVAGTQALFEALKKYQTNL